MFLNQHTCSGCAAQCCIQSDGGGTAGGVVDGDNRSDFTIDDNRVSGLDTIHAVVRNTIGRDINDQGSTTGNRNRGSENNTDRRNNSDPSAGAVYVTCHRCSKIVGVGAVGPCGYDKSVGKGRCWAGVLGSIRPLRNNRGRGSNQSDGYGNTGGCSHGDTVVAIGQLCRVGDLCIGRHVGPGRRGGQSEGNRKQRQPHCGHCNITQTGTKQIQAGIKRSYACSAPGKRRADGFSGLSTGKPFLHFIIHPAQNHHSALIP